MYEDATYVKREQFQLALKRLIYQVLVLVHQVNAGVRSNIVRNTECERIFDFIIELMPKLHDVESKVKVLSSIYVQVIAFTGVATHRLGVIINPILDRE